MNLNFKKTLSRETDALDCIVRSKCCIIDHLSTSFWQALKSGVPTLCFWHQDMHQLDHRFPGYFDELINANILVTDFNNVNEIIYKILKIQMSGGIQRSHYGERKIFEK